MANTIEFDAGQSLRACTERASDLRRAVQALRGELGGAAAAAARTASTARGLQTAFAEAAQPLTGTLNPALHSLQDTAQQLTGSTGGAADGLTGMSKAAATAAKTTAKAVRSLADFDEILRLPAAASSSGGSRSSGKDGEEEEKESSAALTLLDKLRAALADFWASMRGMYAPAIAAWQAAWAQIRDAALGVWDRLYMGLWRLWEYGLKPLAAYLAGTFLPGVVNSFSQAFAPIVGGALSTALTLAAQGVTALANVTREAANTLVLPALQLILTAWQGLMQAVQTAWTAYGQPILDGMSQAVQGLGQMAMQVWSGVVQPVLQSLIGQLGVLWTESLQPLFTDLGLAMGAVTTAVLNLWNEALAPLLAWAVTAFSPAVTALCQTLAESVTGAAGVVAGAADTVLLALRGVADFVSGVLRGQWTEAWQGMGDTLDAVWQRITATVQSAVDLLKNLVGGLAESITAAVQGALSLLDGLGGGISGIKVGRSGASPFSALPALSGPALTVPALARGAVIPPNREFLAVLGDQRTGTNVEAPLAVIEQAVAAAMQDMADGELAALQQVTDTLRQILQAVYGIRVGDEVIGRAAQRYQTRQAVITGGY